MVKYSVVLYLCSIRYGRYGGVSSLKRLVEDTSGGSSGLSDGPTDV